MANVVVLHRTSSQTVSRLSSGAKVIPQLLSGGSFQQVSPEDPRSVQGVEFRACGHTGLGRYESKLME